MSDRAFQMRMRISYDGAENAVKDLQVEQLLEGDWNTFVLSTRSPGFDVFTYAVFTCQQTYLRLNCAERDLVLDTAEGRLEMTTSEDWQMTRLHLDFAVEVKSGVPTEADVAYIVERMQQCPVSKNIKPIADLETRVRFI